MAMCKGLSPNEQTGIEKMGLQNTHFIVSSLNQKYGHSIYFHSNKNHLASILLTQNTLAIIQYLIELVCSKSVCWTQQLLETDLHKQSLEALNQDCFAFQKPLLRMTLPTTPPCQASAEIFKLQISKEHHGIVF